MQYVVTLVNGTQLGPTVEGVQVQEQEDGGLYVWMEREVGDGARRFTEFVAELTIAAGQWRDYGSDNAAELFVQQPAGRTAV